MRSFKRFAVPVLLLILFLVIFAAGWTRRFSAPIERTQESVKIDAGAEKHEKRDVQNPPQDERRIKHGSGL